MRIVEILAEDLIVPDVRATAKNAVIAEVVEHLARVRPEIDGKAALEVLLDRERLGSTGVGHGFAIPHAKLPNLPGVVGCLGRSSRGVEFQSLDGKPAYLFLTLLAPAGSAGMHLKALARASRLFKDQAFRDRLMSESDRVALWRIIKEQDDRLAARDEVKDE